MENRTGRRDNGTVVYWVQTVSPAGTLFADIRVPARLDDLIKGELGHPALLRQQSFAGHVDWDADSRHMTFHHWMDFIPAQGGGDVGVLSEMEVGTDGVARIYESDPGGAWREEWVRVDDGNAAGSATVSMLAMELLEERGVRRDGIFVSVGDHFLSVVQRPVPCNSSQNIMACFAGLNLEGATSIKSAFEQTTVVDRMAWSFAFESSFGSTSTWQIALSTDPRQIGASLRINNWEQTDNHVLQYLPDGGTRVWMLHGLIGPSPFKLQAQVHDKPGTS